MKVSTYFILFSFPFAFLFISVFISDLVDSMSDHKINGFVRLIQKIGDRYQRLAGIIAALATVFAGITKIIELVFKI